MSDPVISGFMKRHGAVPATDRGPDWKHATDAALLQWAGKDCDLWAAGTRDPHLRKRMMEIGEELVRRSDAAGDAADGTLFAMAERIMYTLHLRGE